ncbi:Dynamin-1 [Micractinium conductrix]|uniref:Dynamin-1 n=1 Tax=Micractinium conductrix TaxID=554055 RepID=A0A2P6VLV6_9CHLO|nr:Dynamin-1 [Micractinium conductrix]|eukprot:PSC75068.1 Dynamin-1 [Micractinium conductrix]
MLHTSAVLETAKGAHPLRAAPAGRRVDRGRLVVAAAGPSPPPAEPPSTSPPLGSPSLGAWALSAPETAARAFSSLRGKVAAAHEKHGKSARTAVQAWLGGPDIPSQLIC